MKQVGWPLSIGRPDMGDYAPARSLKAKVVPMPFSAGSHPMEPRWALMISWQR